MSTHITLHRPALAELPALEALYTASFPPEERRPWDMVAAGGDTPCLLCISAPDEPHAGLVSVWRFPQFTYIEHLCTAHALRGRGLGGAVLAALRAEGRPLLLEVEHPQGPDSMEQRRIDFYRRNGFGVLDYPYIQPPYAPGLPEVPLLLMCTDTRIDAAGAARVLHSFVYNSPEPGEKP